MKTCSKCNTDNPNNALHCMVCGAKLGAAAETQNTEAYVDAMFAREERKIRWERRLHCVALGCFAVLYAVLCVMLVRQQDAEVLFAAMGIFALCIFGFVLCVFFPKALFFIEHALSVRNIDEVEPSDWYYISSKLAGYAILVIGIVFLVRLFV